jgi:hypothetical protein
MANNAAVDMAAHGRAAGHKLDAVGWGLFFIWIGIALFANVSWGIGLLGVGIITLGGQVARKYMDLKFETFWIVVGLLFVLGGVWELFSVRVSLVPLVCIGAGVALLVSALVGRPRD